MPAITRPMTIGPHEVTVYPMTRARLAALENLLARSNLQKVRDLAGMIDKRLQDVLLEEAEHDLAWHRFSVMNPDGFTMLGSYEGALWHAAVAVAEDQAGNPAATFGEKMRAVAKAAEAWYGKFSDLPVVPETKEQLSAAGWASFTLARMTAKKEGAPSEAAGSVAPEQLAESSGPASVSSSAGTSA